MFVYERYLKLRKKSTIVYCDLRRKDLPNFVDTSLKIFKKHIGVILKNNNEDINYEVIIKPSHEVGYSSIYVKPDYPPFEIPDIDVLMNRKQYPEYDKLRFDLLKWMISDRLKNVNLSEIPVSYLADLLTLTFMVDQKYVTNDEADLIMLSIKHVQLNLVDEDLECPEFLNDRAFNVTFFFLKFFSTIETSLKMVGLGALTKILNFDGVFFHHFYAKNNIRMDPQLISDINRIYLTET
jgi:hypothetical protein